MTLVVTGRYLFFDETDSSVTGWHRILSIHWVSYTGHSIAADDVFLLSDTGGVMIIGKMAEGDGDGLEVTFPHPGRQVDGVVVTTLGEGVVFIHLEDEILS